jgi:hypothetical protein
MNSVVTNSYRSTTPGELERVRNRLSRHYEIIAQTRMETLGHASSPSDGATLRRLLRALEAQTLPHYFSNPPRWRKLLRRLSRNRTLPDFCVVGPPKCATSDLAVAVLTHPSIIPPLAKELPSPDPEDWRLYYPTARQKARHAQLHGLSLSPYLHPSLHWMEVPYNFSRARPDAKIVIVLRDPVKRLYSHWKWELFLAGKRRAERLPFLATFDAYVNTSLEFHNDGLMYTACGARGLIHSIYWKAVQNWIEQFGENNVVVMNIDDYFADQHAFMQRIQEFIGLPPVEIPQPQKRTNENPIQTPPPDKETIAKLKQFFLPYNRKLWPIIGKQFDW